MKNLFIITVLSVLVTTANAQVEKRVLSTSFGDGYKVELIEENGHQYVLRTPMHLVNKAVDVVLPGEQDSLHKATTVVTYNHHPQSFIIPEVQTDALIMSRLPSISTTMPLRFNAEVKTEIDRILKHRPSVELTIGRASYYMSQIDAHLYTYNVPRIMKYLPFVESSFKINGRSRKGALGLWQFMSPTARLYGMKVSSSGDQRLDPNISSPAAFKYLADLNDMLGSWELALAGYNAGPGRVQRAVRKSGLTNPTYWDIQHLLPSETRRYVPKFIAAVYVMEYYDQMGLYPNHEGYNEAFNEHQKLKEVKFAYAGSSRPSINSAAIPANSVVLNYTVKSGDNIGYIAEWYDVRSTQLRSWNGISGNMIKPGQKLTIYVPANKEQVYASIDKLSFDQKQGERKDPEDERRKLVAALGSDTNFVLYTVQKGDTLWDISRKADVSVDAIKKLNAISNIKSLKPGMVLRIKEK